MNYTQRRKEAKLVPSVRSIGDSYDNALAETINSLYKTEVIWRPRSSPRASSIKMVTLRLIDWFSNHRLFGPNGDTRSQRPKLFAKQSLEAPI